MFNITINYHKDYLKSNEKIELQKKTGSYKPAFTSLHARWTLNGTIWNK